MLTPDQNKQFDEILRELGKSLDITPAQYEAAVKSYEYVGQWLSRPQSPLVPYEPEILPQGSFLLGLMVRPINENDDLDVDLVCRLTGKKLTWSQYDLKKIVGDCLKEHETFKRMLDTEGRRCWTLLHRDDAKFHMDILPAIVSKNFKLLFEKRMSATDLSNVEDLAIRITDKFTLNYTTATDIAEWLKSNPFGYAVWFKMRSALDQYKLFSLNEAVQPIPDPTEQKLPLQIIVQILKRHRDLMFNGDSNKPISIIITTLAAKAYNRQSNVMEGLISVVNNMENFIEERIDAKGRKIKWIGNPVNLEENFADKWPETPAKQANFYKWLNQLKNDLDNIGKQSGLGDIQLAMANIFGSREVNKSFSNLGDKALLQRQERNLKMAAGTGMLGSTGRASIIQHTNYGNGK